MKITFILTDFPAYSQTFILQQVKNLIDEGHELKILANNDPGQEIVQPIFKKYKLGDKTKYYKDNIYDPNSNLRELKSLFEEDVDIFHCHFLPTGIAIFKIMHELKINKPILISTYGVDVMTQLEKNKFLYLNKENIFFIAVSNAIKERLIFLGIESKKIWIVPLTVDVNYFIKINGNNNSLTNFISVCRLVEKKGLDSAIQAFYLLKNKYPQIKFKYSIFGDGPLYDNLTDLIKYFGLKKEVKIYKPITHSQILSIFRRANFLIQTSKTASNGDEEGLPTIILESQACGIPVIGTYHSGIPEEVINNITGFLSHQNNIPEIGQKILKAINIEKSAYKKMSNNARNLILQKFDNNKIKNDIFNIYKNILKNNNFKNIHELKESLSSNLNPEQKYLKVLFFNHTAGLGGSERSLLELIEELQELDVICHVVLPYEGPLSEELKKRAVEYEIIGYYWWCSLEKLSKEEEERRMNESFVNLMEKKTVLDRWNPDLIFTNTLTIPWGSLYAQLANKPHMTFIREFGDLDFNFNFFYGQKESLDFISKNSNFIFTNSKSTLSHFKKYIDPKKLNYSYAYIDVDERLINHKVKKIFKNKNSLKLVLSGAIIPSKGHKDAILAVVKLVKNGKKDIELLIIGTKHYQSFIKELYRIIKTNNLSKNIVFVDFVNNPFPYINQADILLMCSNSEAYGRVTIEAMILKKPVIGTNSGATKELVSDRFNGLLYKHGDHNDLANRIEYFYDNRSKIKQFGNNGYSFYKKTFNKEIYGKKIYDVMKKILENKKKTNVDLQTFLNNYKDSLVHNVLELKNIIKEQNNTQIKMQSDLEGKNKKIEELNNSLSKIHKSKMWKLLYLYKKIIKK